MKNFALAILVITFIVAVFGNVNPDPPTQPAVRSKTYVEKKLFII